MEFHFRLQYLLSIHTKSLFFLRGMTDAPETAEASKIYPQINVILKACVTTCMAYDSQHGRRIVELYVICIFYISSTGESKSAFSQNTSILIPLDAYHGLRLKKLV